MTRKPFPEKLNSQYAKSPNRFRISFALSSPLSMFSCSEKENISKENEYYNYVKDNIFTADLIIWDELNYKEWSEFEQDLMLNIISQRLAMGKANVYTTNYSLTDIEKRLGTRLASRIIGGSELVELKGLDKRGWHNG